jgi:hypothetical protein
VASLLSRTGGGAVAGSIATIPMSAFMLAAQKLSALGKAPPRKINERMMARLRLWVPGRSRRRALSTVAHFAFGATAGGLFGLAAGRLARGPRRVLAGMAYGAAIWAAMYGGALPRLDLMPPPSRDRGGRPATMIAAHLIYGAALGALSRR